MQGNASWYLDHKELSTSMVCTLCLVIFSNEAKIGLGALCAWEYFFFPARSSVSLSRSNPVIVTSRFGFFPNNAV
jgi:hypothetical protein